MDNLLKYEAPFDVLFKANVSTDVLSADLYVRIKIRRVRGGRSVP